MIFLFAPDLGSKIYLEYKKRRAEIAYQVTAGTILLLLLSVVIALVHYPIMFGLWSYPKDMPTLLTPTRYVP